jgi:hypothetical protein
MQRQPMFDHPDGTGKGRQLEDLLRRAEKSQKRRPQSSSIEERRLEALLGGYRLETAKQEE